MHNLFAVFLYLGTTKRTNVWHDSHIIWCIAHFSMVLKYTLRLNACVPSHSTRSQSFLLALRRSNIKWRLTIKILSISHVYTGMIDLSGFRNDKVQFALCESVRMRISGQKKMVILRCGEQRMTNIRWHFNYFLWKCALCVCASALCGVEVNFIRRWRPLKLHKSHDFDCMMAARRTHTRTSFPHLSRMKISNFGREMKKSR